MSDGKENQVPETLDQAADRVRRETKPHTDIINDRSCTHKQKRKAENEYYSKMREFLKNDDPGAVVVLREDLGGKRGKASRIWFRDDARRLRRRYADVLSIADYEVKGEVQESFRKFGAILGEELDRASGLKRSQQGQEVPTSVPRTVTHEKAEAWAESKDMKCIDLEDNGFKFEEEETNKDTKDQYFEFYPRKDQSPATLVIRKDANFESFDKAFDFSGDNSGKVVDLSALDAGEQALAFVAASKNKLSLHTGSTDKLKTLNKAQLEEVIKKVPSKPENEGAINRLKEKYAELNSSASKNPRHNEPPGPM